MWRGCRRFSNTLAEGNFGVAPEAAVGTAPASGHSVEAHRVLSPRQIWWADTLEIDLFRHLQRVVDLYAEVSNRALQLPVA